MANAGPGTNGSQVKHIANVTPKISVLMCHDALCMIDVRVHMHASVIMFIYVAVRLFCMHLQSSVICDGQSSNLTNVIFFSLLFSVVTSHCACSTLYDHSSSCAP
jgi:hypothetical protein